MIPWRGISANEIGESCSLVRATKDGRANEVRRPVPAEESRLESCRKTVLQLRCFPRAIFISRKKSSSLRLVRDIRSHFIFVIEREREGLGG